MLFAFVGCAGVGKNTIIRDLLDAHRDEYDLLPTLTTRAMRPGESEGNPYCFVSEEEFKRQLDEGLIYEHQFIHKSYYGGSRLILEKKLQEGKALLKRWGIEGDWVGVGHCILGYPAADPKPAAPRKPDYIVKV